MKPAIHGRASTAFKVLRVAAVLAALSFAPFAGSAATQEAEVTVDGAATITTDDHPSGTTAPLASGAARVVSSALVGVPRRALRVPRVSWPLVLAPQRTLEAPA